MVECSNVYALVFHSGCEESISKYMIDNTVVNLDVFYPYFLWFWELSWCLKANISTSKYKLKVLAKWNCDFEHHMLFYLLKYTENIATWLRF